MASAAPVSARLAPIAAPRRPRALDLFCRYCGQAMQGRADKRFCSRLCSARSRLGLSRERACLECGAVFPLVARGDANRRHCSKQCAKKRNAKKVATWQAEHPEKMKEYNRNRTAKDPSAWARKCREERAQTIALLGGRCVVCGVTNSSWLHIDYIPTTRGAKFRHPRHPRFVRDHLSDFRLLCANHHYELTLTGKIEGTEITQ